MTASVKYDSFGFGADLVITDLHSTRFFYYQSRCALRACDAMQGQALPVALSHT